MLTVTLAYAGVAAVMCEQYTAAALCWAGAILCLFVLV